MHYRPWKNQLLGGNMDLGGTDAETLGAMLESLTLGFAATGQTWQITHFSTSRHTQSTPATSTFVSSGGLPGTSIA